MRQYKIVSDTGADMSPELFKEWDVACINLTFMFEDNIELKNGDIAFKDFYNRMRNGECAKTSAATSETIKDYIRPLLQEGNDVLYLAFSSGLSATYNSGRLATEELKEEFPEANIVVVDSVAASAGQSLLLHDAVQNRNNGMSLEENAKWLEENKNHLCHWFTVDDLIYLKRGGRISAVSYFAATVLNIKPVLHVDDEGHLISMSKVRGRKASVKALFTKFEELCVDKEHDTIFISHGDCEEDATALAQMIEEKYGNKVQLITNVGAVIGSHSGPGTLALFFHGTQK